MKQNFSKWFKCIIILVFVISSLAINQPNLNTKGVDPFFTLVYKTNDTATKIGTANYIKAQLAEIGIDLDIIIQDWLTFVIELTTTRDFDICHVSLQDNDKDPDQTGLYNEDGSLNIFGYDVTMDWQSDRGDGMNEWYMKQGNLIMPPDSNERIQHYWSWEQYLLDEICPMLPGLNFMYCQTHWANLQGFNLTDELLQSWGKMSWSNSHAGQYLTNEIVTNDHYYRDLNPLNSSDFASKRIYEACLDPLIWIDADKSVWPHLAESYVYLNDTTIEITLRDGIYWLDYDGFTNEKLTTEDVYFTLYSWQEISDDQDEWEWIEKMTIVDEDTIKIFVDNDPGTSANDPFGQSLEMLEVRILPEHYLNQTQLGDGITPDITHSSWPTFNETCFGTGLFQMSGKAPGIGTNLTINTNSWWLDASVDKTNMDFVNRFGDFTGGLLGYRIRDLTDDLVIQSEYENGKLDIIEIYDNIKREQYETDPKLAVQFAYGNTFNFFAFNMRETRTQIGDRTPSEIQPSYSKGLALRKAICYAIDLEKINIDVYEGVRERTHWPMPRTFGIWLYPNIIQYDYNLEQAKYFMYLAGYQLPDYTPTTVPQITAFIGIETYIMIGITFSIIPAIYVLNKKRKK
ncbi:MAG: ABC transporter substrate-binding protein [Candidatus Heimdallarchaeota archaeon]